MATVTLELSDAAKVLLEREVASGHFKNGGALVEILLTHFLWRRDRGNRADFSESERKEIDQMLDEAAASFERGEYVAVRPGEFQEIAQRMAKQASQRQAS